MIDTNSQNKKAKLRAESKYIKKEINHRLKKREEKVLDDKMEKLEKCSDDNTKYHYVMREINRPTHKIPIPVKDEDGNAPGSISEKIKIIEKYFKKTLAPQTMTDEFLSTPPCPMTKKFTAQEIKAIAKRLGNDKAAGSDRLQAEFIKHAPSPYTKR